jgi:hypothetical protein
LHSSPDIIKQIESRRMRWAGHVARMGEGRNVYRVLVGKPERKSPLERPRRRCEDRIKIDLGETGWGGVEWILLAQDRDRWRAVVSAVMNPRLLAPPEFQHFTVRASPMSVLHSTASIVWGNQARREETRGVKKNTNVSEMYGETSLHTGQHLPAPHRKNVTNWFDVLSAAKVTSTRTSMLGQATLSSIM